MMRLLEINMENARFTFAIIVIFLHAYGMVAEFIVRPRDTEAVAGKLTYLNCSISDRTKGVSWYYYAVSASDSTDIYQFGNLQPNYESRARVEKNNDTGTFNLILIQVQKSDAGRYVCQEEGDQPQYSTAELIVLDAIPICGSNTKGNKVIGSNRCDLSNEEIYLSCFTSYFGNMQPTIQWKSNNKHNTIDGAESKRSGSNITSILLIRDVFKSDFFICETTRAAMKQYSCSPGPINIINASDNYVITQKNVGEEATCLAKTSLHCAYKWIWFDDTRAEVIRKTPGVILPKEGMYRCEAECISTEKQCLIIAGLVLVAPDDDSGKSPVFFWLFIIVAVVLLIVIGIIIWIKSKQCRTKKKTADSEKGNKEERVPLESGSSEQAEQSASGVSGILTHAQAEDRVDITEEEKRPVMETATPSTATEVRTRIGVHPDSSETDVHGGPHAISDEVQTAHAMNPGMSPAPAEVQIGSGVQPDNSGTDVSRAPPVISGEVQTAREMNPGTSSTSTEVQHPSCVHSDSSETGASNQTMVGNPIRIPSENAQVHTSEQSEG